MDSRCKTRLARRFEVASSMHGSGPSFSHWCDDFDSAITLCAPTVRPAATADCAARSLTSVWKSNNSCCLEHGHPGYGGTKTLSTSTGSRVGRSPAGNDSALVLSRSPRVTSGKLHGRAGVRDVSLPEDPFPRHMVGVTWLSEADSMGISM